MLTRVMHQVSRVFDLNHYIMHRPDIGKQTEFNYK